MISSPRRAEHFDPGLARPGASDACKPGHLWVRGVGEPGWAVSQRDQSRSPSRPRLHPPSLPAHRHLLGGLPSPIQSSLSACGGGEAHAGGGSEEPDGLSQAKTLPFLPLALMLLRPFSPTAQLHGLPPPRGHPSPGPVPKGPRPPCPLRVVSCLRPQPTTSALT